MGFWSNVDASISQSIIIYYLPLDAGSILVRVSHLRFPFFRIKFQNQEYCSIFAENKLFAMVVISKAVLKEFAEKHPDAEAALIKWYNETKVADWRNFSELKKTFNTADAVANDRYIFDIKGNQYRLIALIIFRKRTVFILFVGTHKEYDKIDASTIQYKK